MAFLSPSPKDFNFAMFSWKSFSIRMRELMIKMQAFAPWSYGVLRPNTSSISTLSILSYVENSCHMLSFSDWFLIASSSFLKLVLCPSNSNNNPISLKKKVLSCWEREWNYQKYPKEENLAAWKSRKRENSCPPLTLIHFFCVLYKGWSIN